MAVFTAIGVSVATGLAAVGAAATIYGVSQQQKAISSQRRAAQTQAAMQRDKHPVKDVVLLGSLYLQEHNFKLQHK